ncbi:MAG: ATP-binding protein, partial [Nitrospiraceae bacterium]|nr:ATP-binding protein [Nitrospiraceae bacterium]
KEIELDVRLEDGLPNIKADYSQIGQVILNLAINARDAMPDGGRLVIATSLVGGENGAANGLKPANGVNFVRLTVEDTGTGIPKDYQGKIFDPFFTTKDPGKGTGLGLYMVHSIVTNHGGYINLYSEPNRGTRFNVYFPAYLAKMEEVKEEEGIIEGKGETVLVIDDEAYICDLYTDVLTMAGYNVIRATEPREGVKIFKENPHIDLVILDLVMPQMNGREVFQILMKLNPEARVILSSGYSAELFADINKLITSGAKAFMQKPVSPNTLLSTISKVLRR